MLPFALVIWPALWACLCVLRVLKRRPLTLQRRKHKVIFTGYALIYEYKLRPPDANNSASSPSYLPEFMPPAATTSTDTTPHTPRPLTRRRMLPPVGFRTGRVEGRNGGAPDAGTASVFTRCMARGRQAWYGAGVVLVAGGQIAVMAFLIINLVFTLSHSRLLPSSALRPTPTFTTTTTPLTTATTLPPATRRLTDAYTHPTHVNAAAAATAPHTHASLATVVHPWLRGAAGGVSLEDTEEERGSGRLASEGNGRSQVKKQQQQLDVHGEEPPLPPQQQQQQPSSTSSSSSTPPFHVTTLMHPMLPDAHTHTPLYLWLAALLALAFHELGHALAARSEGLTIRYAGLYLAVVVPGAFVIIDGRLKYMTPSQQLRVVCAGVWHNVLLCLLLVAALRMDVSWPLYSSGDGVIITSVPPTSPFAHTLSPGTLITAIQDHPTPTISHLAHVLHAQHTAAQNRSVSFSAAIANAVDDDLSTAVNRMLSTGGRGITSVLWTSGLLQRGAMCGVRASDAGDHRRGGDGGRGSRGGDDGLGGGGNGDGGDRVDITVGGGNGGGDDVTIGGGGGGAGGGDGGSSDSAYATDAAAASSPPRTHTTHTYDANPRRLLAGAGDLKANDARYYDETVVRGMSVSDTHDDIPACCTFAALSGENTTTSSQHGSCFLLLSHTAPTLTCMRARAVLSSTAVTSVSTYDDLQSMVSAHVHDADRVCVAPVNLPPNALIKLTTTVTDEEGCRGSYGPCVRVRTDGTASSGQRIVAFEGTYDEMLHGIGLSDYHPKPLVTALLPLRWALRLPSGLASLSLTLLDVSFSVAVLNLIPAPHLDGEHASKQLLKLLWLRAGGGWRGRWYADYEGVHRCLKLGSCILLVSNVVLGLLSVF